MPLKVVIVGAGIGGLAAGAALAQNGHSVTIYERAQIATDVGFAFRITANSDRCLKHLGIDTVATGATQANTARQLDVDGNVIIEFGENKDAEQVKRGVSVFASRPQIVRELLAKAHELGVIVKTDVGVKTVDIEKTTIMLNDGTQVSGDLIVGSDGLHSAVRSSVVDTNIHKPHPTLEQNCFRFMVPRSVIQNDEVLSQVFTNQFRLVSWKGQDKLVISYPVDFDSQYNFVCSHPAHLSENNIRDHDANSPEGSMTKAAYDKKVSVDAVHHIYSDFEARLHRLFDKADPDGFRIWKLQDLEELPRWSVNRTVLIGDTAHAVLPFGFSGASMTIEDAIVLAELLPRDVGVEAVPERLQLLEKVRKPRLQRVKETSVMIGGGEQRPEIIRGYMEWLSAYDAVQVGRDALEKLTVDRT